MSISTDDQQLQTALRGMVVDAVRRLNIPEGNVEKYGVINAVEAALLEFPQIDNYEVQHYAFPGFIARQALLRAGTMITTDRHLTWHPYVISYGHVLVYDEVKDRVFDTHAHDVPNGHFTSLTEPGTRRLILVAQDTLWTTFHPAKHDDPERLYKEVIAPNTNPLLP